MATTMPLIAVEIDGQRVEIQLAQADYVRAEKDGFRFVDGENPGGLGLATIAWHAVCRAKRRGLIDITVPDSFEDFLDGYEFPKDQPKEADPEGEGSGQAPITG